MTCYDTIGQKFELRRTVREEDRYHNDDAGRGYDLKFTIMF